MYAAALLALLATASATPIVGNDMRTRNNLNLVGQDFEIINLARNLESLELNYWASGLQNYSDADFAAAGYPGIRTFVELFRDQEVAHFTTLNTALGGGFKNCSYNFKTNSPFEFFSMAQVVTTVGEGAFIGAAGLLNNAVARETGAEIIGNEARQNSFLRDTIGLNFFNAVNFDTPFTASQAYSLAKPFLGVCPSSNPPVDFTVIPPIMANFTSAALPHSAGDEIAVSWDSSKVYLGDDVHITFLGDVYSIPCPLKQTGDGMGTTNLPKGINGTSILVATNYDGPAPIPDGQNFGIGFVVVA